MRQDNRAEPAPATNYLTIEIDHKVPHV